MLQQFERGLRLPIAYPSASPYRNQKGEEQDPEDEPEKPPIGVHSRPVIAVHRDLFVTVWNSSPS
jgi:hypothetical protein